MLFNSISFLYYFLPTVILLYFIVPKKAKNFVLFVSSILFYFYLLLYIPRKAARFPLLPWDALWEKRKSGLQQVQIFVTAIFSFKTPASVRTISFALQRSSWYLPFFLSSKISSACPGNASLKASATSSLTS